MKFNIIFTVSIFILILCSCSDVSGPGGSSKDSGRIYGFVLDKITKQAIPDARIVISQSGMFTSTDSSGYFEIDSLKGGYYSLYAIRENYYRDSVNIYLRSNEEFSTNLIISFKGLYAITDSTQYHLIYPQNNITVRIINNAEFTHYLWWWCGIMYGSFRYNGTNWESFDVGPPCIHLYAQDLIQLAAKDSIFTSMSVNGEGTFYIHFHYRIAENDVDRNLYTNIFEVLRN